MNNRIWLPSAFGAERENTNQANQTYQGCPKGGQATFLFSDPEGGSIVPRVPKDADSKSTPCMEHTAPCKKPSLCRCPAEWMASGGQPPHISTSVEVGHKSRRHHALRCVLARLLTAAHMHACMHHPGPGERTPHAPRCTAKCEHHPHPAQDPVCAVVRVQQAACPAQRDTELSRIGVLLQ